MTGRERYQKALNAGTIQFSRFMRDQAIASIVPQIEEAIIAEFANDIPDWFTSREWQTIIAGLEAAADQYLTDAKTNESGVLTHMPKPEHSFARLAEQFRRQAEEAKALSVRLRDHFGL